MTKFQAFDRLNHSHVVNCHIILYINFPHNLSFIYNALLRHYVVEVEMKFAILASLAGSSGGPPGILAKPMRSEKQQILASE